MPANSQFLRAQVLKTLTLCFLAAVLLIPFLAVKFGLLALVLPFVTSCVGCVLHLGYLGRLQRVARALRTVSSIMSPATTSSSIAAVAAEVITVTPPHQAVPGTLINVYPKDPSVVRQLALKQVFFPDPAQTIQAGPSDDSISTIASRSDIHVEFDAERNFLFDPQRQPVKFDAAATYAVVRMTLDMYRRALKQTGLRQRLNWQWGHDQIKLFPGEEKMQNAFYSRHYRALVFGYFTDHEGRSIQTDRAADIVAHETGHAILDALKPTWYASQYSETRALHEAFADITAILFLLSQLDICDRIITNSKGYLHQQSLFSLMGEEFAHAMGLVGGIRNAANQTKLGEIRDLEPHLLSTVFTGAVYEILVKLFDHRKDDGMAQYAQTLYQVGQELLSIVVKAIVHAPPDAPTFVAKVTFADVANSMINSHPHQDVKTIMRQVFSDRQILGPHRATLPKQITYTAASSSQTLQRRCGCCTLDVDTKQHAGLITLMNKHGLFARSALSSSQQPQPPSAPPLPYLI